jgi:hypothetical protein
VLPNTDYSCGHSNRLSPGIYLFGGSCKKPQDQNAFLSDWSIQPLTVQARYARVTVNGNPTTNATEARELQIYGTPGSTPTPTPTPTPGLVACSQYTPSSTIPTGYASPYDVVTSPNTNLMNVTCLTLTDARLDLGRGDPLQYIYNQGYLFNSTLAIFPATS